MAFINDRKPLGRKKAKKIVKTRANRFKGVDGKVFASDLGYSFDVLPKDGYSSEVPNLLPAPPENCTYVFDERGNATLKCSDVPADVYVSNPVDTGVLSSSYASFNFPNWSTLTCEEIGKYIAAIEQEMTYIRVTPDILAIYNKQLEYARLLLSEKCKKAVDLELGLCPERPLAPPPVGKKYIQVKNPNSPCPDYILVDDTEYLSSFIAPDVILDCNNVNSIIQSVQQNLPQLTDEGIMEYNNWLQNAQKISAGCTSGGGEGIGNDFGTGTGGTGVVTGTGGTGVVTGTGTGVVTGTGTGVVTGTGTGVVTGTNVGPTQKAPFKFNWWWAVAAGVGLYLITKSNK